LPFAEKTWPGAEFIYLQEAALEFLFVNNFDIEGTLTKIRERRDDFKSFLIGILNIFY
jgi:hypothetical protein